jgi:FkbM family methyltransferase
VFRRAVGGWKGDHGMTPETSLFLPERQFLRMALVAGYHPETVYDIGASNGIWSEMIATVLPGAKYELFEPLAEQSGYAFDLASRMRRLKQLRLHPIALADQNGEQQIHVAQDIYGSSLRDRGDIPEVRERISVKVFRLDDYVAQNALPPPNIVKMDCQGFEDSIIRGGIQTVSQADVLFIETWLKRGYGPKTPLLSEIIEMLQPLSFTIVELGEKFFDDRHRLYSVDAFFCSERFLAEYRLPA